ncbi:PorP/SprF family type IX secretion system membrane protein [Chryseolinea lacunae]|uniref:Type IX secretion system membrane protein PorP/SprF n=1 Tax=Chryseolinea lacunae TaxID=2801331 RepID=A0ABS1KNV0_9BACT|nr:type IX secretion system membrane protein PorP/SprF [Chryseolinea lacunae]MBL0741019.1 type IX secretion system membrane protein PorP/SprF [Chryseolinea lacunae]
MRFFLIAIVLLFSCAVVTRAQQRPQFTQYMFNGLVLNPAYAGADEALSLTFMNRAQWRGIEGAPVTQTLTAHTLFGKQHIGVGLSIMNEKIGIHKNQRFMASTAYHLKVSEKSVVSVGLQGGVNVLKSNYGALNTGAAGATDPRLANTGYSNAYANLGLGVYYRSPTWRAGLSAPSLLPERFSESDSSTINWQRANYFLFASYRVVLTSSLSLEPGVLVKYNQGLPVSFDVNALLIIKQALTLGLSYRRSESLDFLMKAQVTPQLQLGYAYDFVVGQVSSVSRGTHELMVNYIFKYTHENVSSPR